MCLRKVSFFTFYVDTFLLPAYLIAHLVLFLLVLRLYPSVPVNTRTAHRTTVLPVGGGPDQGSPVLIRKGQNVAFCVCDASPG